MLRLSAAEDAPDATEVIEAIALDLRTELADAGALRLEQVPLGGAPEGTRGLAEIVAVCSFVITAVQAGESMGRVVAAVRRVVDRYTRRRQRVRVTIAGVDIDLATADDEATARLVRALLALPAQPPVGVREALVIANAHYDDPGLAQLRSPSHDADALARVLGDPTIGGFNVELMTDADERSIRRRIAAFFANRDRDDLLLLHFSCHGVKDTRGRLHLAARDTDLSVLGATSVPASFVHEALDETQSRRVVLILDCCYSGAFTRGATVRSGNDVHIADEFGAGSGRVVLTASSATEYAFEGGDLTQAQAQPSVFTAALVDGLQSGAADLDADGEISIDELYDYTYRTVRDRTPGQAPMKWSFGVEGSLVVARSVRAPALPQSIVDDLASERVVLRLEAVRALAQLSTSDKPALADLATVTLARLSDTDDSAQVRRAASTALAGDTKTPAADDEPGTDSVRRQPTAPEADQAPPRPAPAPASAPPPAAVGEPDGGTAPAATAATARSASGHPAVREAGGLLLAASLLVTISVLLYAIAVYGIAEVPLSDDWYHNLVWVVQVAGAGLLLATRQSRWAWFLLGVLAWAWVDLAPTLHSSVQSHFQDAWGFMVTADLVAIAAQACLVVAITRDRTNRFRPDAIRAATAVLLAALALTTTLLLVPLLYESWHLNTGEGTTLRAFAGIACAVVIPAVVIAGRGAVFLPLGWLLGGAELTLTGSVNLFRDGTSDRNYTILTVVWILLVLTTAAAIAASSLLRSRPTNQPAERTVNPRR
ncbi:caspase, EACC1-associated type [Phytohabitans sp. LJ34]|uniref:caspase, EACC1-associated type n=1 Tax=Phytohabitans sp. LJ34 TaxID=3452217 RepID=UPI003F8BDA15